jgi:hypothetical protein
MPALLERLFPFLGRTHTKQGFLKLALISTAFAQENGLDPHLLHGWEQISTLAANTLILLFVEKKNPKINWGLHDKCNLLEIADISTLQHWMTLYFLGLFRDYGVDGCNPAQDFAAMAQCGEGLGKYYGELFSKNPGSTLPFSKTWKTDEPTANARQMCLATHRILGLHPSSFVSTIGVVAFFATTSTAYEMVTSRP